MIDFRSIAIDGSVGRPHADEATGQSGPAHGAASYLERYRRGEWRDSIFRDMILDDIAIDGRPLTILDIGCGHGFDGDLGIQQSMADVSAQFIGVEPDLNVNPADHFTEIFRCELENTTIRHSSIDVAYAIMVLEHLPDPQLFFDKIWYVLREGGVFWGLTVDARHWFCRVSKLFEVLRIKDAYLTILLGKRGTARYENYPVFYRSNTPAKISDLCKRFYRIDFVSFSRVGQCASYLPALLRPPVAAIDRLDLRNNKPGTLLAVRLQK